MVEICAEVIYECSLAVASQQSDRKHVSATAAKRDRGKTDAAAAVAVVRGVSEIEGRWLLFRSHAKSEADDVICT